MNLTAITTCRRPGGASYLSSLLRQLDGVHDVAVFDDVELRGSRWNTWRALHAGGFADRLLLLQDDIEIESGFVDRAFSMFIPSNVGFVTFHDFGTDFLFQTVPAGVHHFPAHQFGGWGLCGAQALLMTGAHAGWLAGQDMNACPQPGPHGADFAIGWWTSRSSRPNKLIVSPSPIRHIGERSACHDEERRAAGVGIPHAGRTLNDILREARTCTI